MSSLTLQTGTYHVLVQFDPVPPQTKEPESRNVRYWSFGEKRWVDEIDLWCLCGNKKMLMEAKGKQMHTRIIKYIIKPVPSNHSKHAGEPLPLTVDKYGGESGEQENALHSALLLCAKEEEFEGEYAEYEWIEKTPRTSMIVFLTEALHRHGYHITKD